jgi:hypothetical protein
MKNMAKFIGITALAAVIVFSFTACGGGGGGIDSNTLENEVKFPVIFKEGKFCDGVSVTTGNTKLTLAKMRVYRKVKLL